MDLPGFQALKCSPTVFCEISGTVSEGWFWHVLGWGSAGSVLRAQGSSGEDELSRCARGECLIASNACSGPVPLLLAAGSHLITQKGALLFIFR